MHGMATVVAANLQANPFCAVNGEPVTPIGYIKYSLEPLHFCSERRISVVRPAAIYDRVNSLANMAGALTLGYAKTVVDLVATQLYGFGTSFT